MRLPTIYLAVSNRFAAGLWTVPEEWIRIIRKWRVKYIEAHSEVEADPLRCGADYIRHWGHEIDYAARRHNVNIIGVHATLSGGTAQGMSHKDSQVRRRTRDDWLKPLINVGANLKGRVGFQMHSIAQSSLHDAEFYPIVHRKLVDKLAYLALYARGQSLEYLSIDPGCSPRKPPWTIAGCRNMVAEIYDIHKAPLYVGLNMSVASGQGRYLKPTVRHIASALRIAQENDDLGKIWFGTKAAYDLFEDAIASGASIPDLVRDLRPALRMEVDKHPWLFSEEEDSDIYSWIREFGAYSPVIRLFQNNGTSDDQLPFTKDNNVVGRVEPRKVLRAITESYQRPPPHGMPPRCDKIYLTLEIIPSSDRRPREILDMMKESVMYWRKFIPEDGTPIEQLTKDGPGVIDSPIEEIRKPGWMLPGNKG